MKLTPTRPNWVLEIDEWVKTQNNPTIENLKLCINQEKIGLRPSIYEEIPGYMNHDKAKHYWDNYYNKIEQQPIKEMELKVSFTVSGNKYLLEALVKELRINHGFKCHWSSSYLYIKRSSRPTEEYSIHGTNNKDEISNYELPLQYEEAKQAFIKLGEKSLIKIGDYDVEISPNNHGIMFATINGCSYHKDFISMLVTQMGQGQIKSLNVGCEGQYKVDKQLLEKILARMK